MVRQKVSSHLRSVPGRKQKVRVKSYERTVPKKKSTTKKKSTAKKKSGQTKIGAYGRRVLKASTRQTGRSHTKRDSARKAMQPGKRRSASGRVYYEHRKNRSDLRGRRV
jgi:hypothetical protein